ncbi:MAG TPA: chloride channel protein [Gaiella sp.]|nr:chloride channel protein [Gaiella sp.]HEX5027446.1 chloride channel protein [Gaiellaceae bacterium]
MAHGRNAGVAPGGPSGAGGLDGRAYLRLVLLGAAIGVPAALVAALFLALVHDLEHWLWHDLPDALGHSSAPWYLVVGIPVAGAAIVVGARLLLPGDGGHSPIEGLSMAPTPIADAPGVALAALGTLPFGAVLGPEAPVIALGSVVGVAAARFSPAGERATKVLASAGGFAAISALFGGPLVAGMLLVEGGIGMGAVLLPILLPGLVAAGVGYLVFVGFGDWGGLEAPGLVVSDLPLYDGVHLLDLVVAVVIGVVGALIVLVARRAGERVDGLGGRLALPALLLGGGLAVGLLAELGGRLGADPMDILFSGQASLNAVTSAGSTKIVLILLVGKLLAYVVSLGCGFRGGPVFPAIFLGVALASLTVVVFDVSPTLAVAVGTAAGAAAQTRLLITPVLLAAVLVGTQGTDAIPAAVLASAAAWLTMAAIEGVELGPETPVEKRPAT